MAPVTPSAPLIELLRREPELFPVLLDSAADGPLARRSLLAAMPLARLALDSGGVLHAEGDLPEAIRGLHRQRGGFFDALEAWWRCVHREWPAARGLAGGWIVYLGYEMAGECEPRLQLPAGAQRWRAVAMRVGAAIEQIQGDAALRYHLLSEDPGARQHLERLVARTLARSAPAQVGSGLRIETEEEPPELFLERVRRAQEHIRDGDIYQANLSRWWRAPSIAASEVVGLYERLRAANPAPFAALARFGDLDVLSSSPERLLRIEGRTASTRPIAGTRPRTLGRGTDAPEAAALVSHPKERAEHVMLIDLERNDLGRICTAGSVRVDEYMGIESYAHVHHLVSNVSGQLRADVTPIAALKALFPGGTITGVPKFRCMQIIAELEGEGRDAYTGSLGWLSPAGDADFNILIRTLVNGAGVLEARAGAGIVADSDPQRELAETRAKARGLLLALEAGA